MDWLVLPFYGTAIFVIGVMVVLTAVVCSVLAIVPLRVGGGLGRNERAPISLPGKLFVLLCSLAPIPCTLSLLGFVMPLRAPMDILFVSRSVGGPEDQEALATARRELVAERPDLLDATVVATAAVQELEAFSSEWLKDEGLRRAEVRDIVIRALDTVSLEAPTASDAPPGISTLPRWLLESVELAVLKAVTQRYNVRELHVVASKRPTLAGSTWELAEPYLERGSIRSRGTVVETVLRQEESTTELVAASLRLTDGGLVLDVWVALGRCPGCQAARTLRFGIYSAGMLIRVVPAPIAPSAGVDVIERLTVSVSLPSQVDLSELRIRLDGSDRTRRVQTAGNIAVKFAVMTSAADQWRSTRDYLITSGEANVRSWRQSLAAEQIDVQRSEVTVQANCGSRAPADVVLVRDCGGAVRISAPGVDADTVVGATPAETSAFYRVRLSQLGKGGISSLDGAFFSANQVSFSPMTSWRGAVARCRLSQVELIPQTIGDGALGDPRRRPPLVVGWDFVSQSGAELNGTDVYLASGGTVLKAEQAVPSDLASFFGAWTEIFRAARSAASGGWVCGASASQENELGITTVLTSSDLQAIQGRGLEFQLSVILACVALYSGVFYRGLR